MPPLCRLALATAGVLLLAACNGIELDTRSANAIDFSGEWVIDFADSDQVPNVRRPERFDRRRLSRRDIAGSGLEFVAHDFQVLTADKLTIEQNRDSMGIRYEPGVYRDVSWGERQRGLWEVYAGWELDDLVIISAAPDLKVTERLVRLSARRLRVDVAIRADGEDFQLQRFFDKR